MAKKTKTALKELIKALEKHVEVLSNPKSSRSKRERATEAVKAAAISYSSVLNSRTGSASPFAGLPDPSLDESTVASLRAENAALRAKHSAKHTPSDAPSQAEAQTLGLAEAPVPAEAAHADLAEPGHS